MTDRGQLELVKRLFAVIGPTDEALVHADGTLAAAGLLGEDGATLRDRAGKPGDWRAHSLGVYRGRSGQQSRGLPDRFEVEAVVRFTRRNKYGVAPAEERQAHGITFHSKKERDLYLQLFALNRAGNIRDLKRQVRFPLVTKGDRVVSHYVADFTYNDPDGTFHVVDAKGFKTPEYKLKKNWLETQHPELRIEEV